MQYCPNCSAYQIDHGFKRCSKCGFDISLAIEPAVNAEDPKKKEREVDLSKFDADRPCNICSSPTKDLTGEFDFTVEGERISIYGLKLMGGEIMKKPSTLVTFRIKGLECSEGHRFFKEATNRIKPLCPVCYDVMMRYGSSLYSCPRCQKHFPVQSWPSPDPETVLAENGWAPL